MFVNIIYKDSFSCRARGPPLVTRAGSNFFSLSAVEEEAYVIFLFLPSFISAVEEEAPLVTRAGIVLAFSAVEEEAYVIFLFLPSFISAVEEEAPLVTRAGIVLASNFRVIATYF